LNKCPVSAASGYDGIFFAHFCRRQAPQLLNVKVIDALLIQDRTDVSLVMQNADYSKNVVPDEVVYVKLVESLNRP